MCLLSISFSKQDPEVAQVADGRPRLQSVLRQRHEPEQRLGRGQIDAQAAALFVQPGLGTRHGEEHEQFRRTELQQSAEPERQLIARQSR